MDTKHGNVLLHIKLVLKSMRHKCNVLYKTKPKQFILLINSVGAPNAIMWIFIYYYCHDNFTVPHIVKKKWRVCGCFGGCAGIINQRWAFPRKFNGIFDVCLIHRLKMSCFVVQARRHDASVPTVTNVRRRKRLRQCQ